MTYEDLAKIFDNPVDYSQSFSDDMASLAKKIAGSVGIDVHHDQDMNYAAAQKIGLWTDDYGYPCARESDSCRYELRFYVSSKAKVYCVIYMARMNRNHWQKLPNETAVPPPIESIRESIEAVFFKEGYEEVEDHFLQMEVPDRFDELDGAPATVFSILFAELL